MSYDIIMDENVSSFIDQLEQNLRDYDEFFKNIEMEVSVLDNDFQKISYDIDSHLQELNTTLSDVISNIDEIHSFVDNEEIFLDDVTIDLNRFVGVLGKIDDSILEIKNDLLEVRKQNCSNEATVCNESLIGNSIFPKRNKKESKIGRKKNSLFVANVKSGQCYQCCVCMGSIDIGTLCVRHNAGDHTGSMLLPAKYYHCSRICLLAQDLNQVCLSEAKVVLEEVTDSDVMERLRDIGFSVENIRTEHKSECEDGPPTSMPALVRDEGGAAHRFTYTRKNNKKKVICASCQEVIVGSYITLGTTDARPLHIERKCVLENGVSKIDFNRVRCFVFKALQTHKDLTDLISCGFHYNRIIGDKPQNPLKKGFNRDNEASIAVPKVVHFFYRRNENPLNLTPTCVGCSRHIFQSSYLTRGDNLFAPLHIDRKCIQSGEAVDFGRVQCKVFMLLNNYQELLQLLACGFYMNNIIGVRPQNPNMPVGKGFQKESSPIRSQDVGFIFNVEAFTCERVMQGEKCQGCSQSMKQGTISLRHKERVPREKQVTTPLISQFYHATMNCLIKRGFTEKYLEFAQCYVVLTDSDDKQKMRDLLVRCGFSSDNLSFAPIKVDNPPVSMSPSSLDQAAPKLLLFVVTCSKSSAFCGGCGFNIALNQACFLYGTGPDQACGARLFHISEACLTSGFTKTEIAAMVCVNNNSMADVEAADIERCGVRTIVGLVRPDCRGPHRRIAEEEAALTAPQRDPRAERCQWGPAVESRDRGRARVAPRRGVSKPSVRGHFRRPPHGASARPLDSDSR